MSAPYRKPKSVEVLEALEVPTLAERIGALHREIQAQPGRYEEMHKLLTQAQKDAGEGGWLKWLAENKGVLGFGVRQAQSYLLPGEARAAHKTRHAEGEKKRRAATKKSKPKLTEAERLALKAGTAALNPLTGKVISLIHTCGVPGCGQPAFTTSTICEHLLCEAHGADISCSINQVQVCPACASDTGSTTEIPEAATLGGKKKTAKVLPETESPVAEPKAEMVDEGQQRQKNAGWAVGQIETWVGRLEQYSESISPGYRVRLKACHQRIGALLKKRAEVEVAPEAAGGPPAAPEPQP